MKKTKAVDPILAGLLKSGPTKGEIQKNRIIEAAVECIATAGIESTSHELIGQKVGVRKSLVAYHFKDRSEIIETAMVYITRCAQAVTVERVTKAEPGLARLYAVGEAALDWADEKPFQSITMALLLYYAAYNDRYREMFGEIRLVGVQRIQMLLEREVIPSLRPTAEKIDSLVAAKSIQDLITGTVVDYLTTGKGTKRPEKERALFRQRLSRAIRKLL